MRLRFHGLLAVTLLPALSLPAQAHAPTGQAKLPVAGQKPPRTDLYGDPLPKGALSRLGTMRLHHGLFATALAFAPDGKVLVSAGRLPSGVCFWDAGTGQLLRRLPDFSFVISVAFSPDGKLLVTAGDRLTILDAATGKELRRLKGPRDTVDLVAFSPDGTTLAAAEFGAPQVLLWDVTANKELRRLPGHTDGVNALAFSPADGKLLASASDDKAVRLWDVATGKELRRLEGHNRPVTAVGFAPGGKVLASGGEDSVIRLWDVASGKSLRQLQGHQGVVVAVAFAPDGKRLASFGRDGTVRLWDAETGQELRRWEVETRGLGSVAFAPDGKRLAAAAGSCIRLWDTATGAEISLGAGHTGMIQSLRLAADGKTLFSVGADRAVLEWDLTTSQKGSRLCGGKLGPAGPARWLAVDVSPDGKVLAQVSLLLPEGKADPAIHLWDAVTGKQLGSLSGHAGAVRALRLAPDGKLLASAGQDGIRLWDVAAGKSLLHLPLGPGGGSVLDLSPDGQWLAFADEDQTIHLWDIAAKQELRHWDSHLEGVSVLVFSADGQSLAGLGPDTVRVWAAATGKEVARFGDSTSRFLTLAVAPSGRVLALAEFSRPSLSNGRFTEVCTVRLVEAHSGQEIRRLDVPQGLVLALAFTPDGRSLVSGGGDATLLLWDVTGRLEDALPQGPLTTVELAGLWSALEGNAAQADRAIWALALAPKQSVPFLRERLRPAAPADAQRVAELVADLDGKSYAVRQAALRGLEELGETAEAQLRKILTDNPNLELRRRLEEILAKRQPEVVRQLRAVEALEHSGTAEARQTLEVLAQVTPNPRLAQAAAAALQRLSKRPAAP
jgi:WD40 repeat protein